MVVYTLTYEDYSNGDKYTSVWSDEQAAQKQAVAELLDNIRDFWDMTDQDLKDVAIRIDNLAKLGAYISAMEEYEQWQLNKNGGPDGISWTIEGKDLNDQHNVSSLTFIDFSSLQEDEDEIHQALQDPQLSIYQATTCGATCRGTCATWNEYAWADRADQTYVCYSCRSNGAS